MTLEELNALPPDQLQAYMEKQKRVIKAQISTMEIVKESELRGYDEAKKATASVWSKLQKIEEKQSCLRVRFLDWLSDKLLAWSKTVHEMSVRIDSPCVIRLPETKKVPRSAWKVKLGEKK